MKKKWIAVLLLASIGGTSLQPVAAYAGKGNSELGTQIATDLVAGGVSIAAALSGNVPLAFMAGYLTKYISTYGVAGIKALIEVFKGYSPQDLGEINLYYTYLIHVKRNLYQALINVRKSVETDNALAGLEAELKEVEALIAGQCDVASGCQPTGLDYSLINYQFLNILLDAKQSIDVSRHLAAQEVKNTYQYLMLLYLDVVIIEQKLIEAQFNVMANRTVDSLELLKKNKYLSNEEKEFQAQLVMNMALRWMHMADTRRIIVAGAIEAPLQTLGSENDQLEDQIDEYKKLQEKWRKRK